MVTEKHLALLASTISLVLATMSATALIMVNSARTEMKTQYEESQREIGKLNSLVSQLKENQIAMLPFLGRPSESAAAKGQVAQDEVQQPASNQSDSSPGQPEAAPAVTEPKVESPPTPKIAAAVSQHEIPVGIAKPAIPLGPAAPTPAGVKVFTATDSRIEESPVRESGAPQASVAKVEDTILAAVQTPSMGLKPHPVLDQIKAPVVVDTPKVLESVDGILVSKIISNWKRPVSARNGMVVEILIKMGREGDVSSAKVVKSSGDKAFDSSATSAIMAVKQLPEMTQVSDSTYQRLYKERRVRFSPEDLSG
ncbi:TonB family protein (plasmid) [Pseudomonas cannabina pv. alisalensis]|uniref:TonB family protein n=1 Tax=Pseudomonas syringae pv. maculicola str. ES4326 TaxID=629265 RepID=A0A8T8CA28_PSEYM|nr:MULTISPECIES: TonB family protein [Pseudomonas syringae group]QHF00486.1 TonB family protein [Pseudomonas syringae pv. maculicola str. ES4326]UBZ00464.1 TonB family protein [Pseudomonas cannabina pv. alisalensis]